MTRIVLLLLATLVGIYECSDKLLVCYYTNWAQYRPKEGALFPEDIDATLCTHIIYAFAKVVDDKIEPYEWNDRDLEWSKGLYTRVINLKLKNPQLKVLIGLGGWNHGPESFSRMVHDEKMRKNFVNNALIYLKENRFDGLDLDWEYPGSRNGSIPTDKQLFTKLIKELKDALKPHNYLLTAAVAAGKSNIDKGYEIPKLSEYLDFVNLMAYDLHGAWEDFVDHNSPLYSRRSEKGESCYLNTDWAVNYWLSNGLPKEKLVLGLAMYGRVFKLDNPNNNDVYAKNNGTGVPGKFTREAGFLSYFEICENLIEHKWKSKWSDEQHVPYAYTTNEWVGYENIKSIKIKARYVLEKKLAGVMFWTLDLDDFSGQFCRQGKYPLIKTVISVLKNPQNTNLVQKNETTFIYNYNQNNTYNININKLDPNNNEPVKSKSEPNNHYNYNNRKVNVDPGKTDNIKPKNEPSRIWTKSIVKHSTIPTTTTTTTTASLVKSPGQQNTNMVSAEDAVKLFKCTQDGLYPNLMTRCRSFIQCANSNTAHEIKANVDCPSDLLFNRQLNRCDWITDVEECIQD